MSASAGSGHAGPPETERRNGAFAVQSGIRRLNPIPGMGAISRDFGGPNGSTAEKVEISRGHSASK